MNAFWWSLTVIGWTVAVSLAVLATVSLTWLIKQCRTNEGDIDAEDQ